MRFLRHLIIVFLILATACIPARRRDIPVPREPLATPDVLPDTISIGLRVAVDSVIVTIPAGSLVTGEAESRRVGTGGQIRFSADETGVRCGDLGIGASAVIRIQSPPDLHLALGATRWHGEFFIRNASDSTHPVALTLVNVLPLEDYLKAVVPREIGIIREDHFEAMKAQAITARTYSVRNKGRRKAFGFDLFATSEDQVYGGVNAETTPTSRAVDQTAGEILVYGDDLVEAYYHSTCGGHTASMKDAWNVDRPYLRGTDDWLGDTFACASSKYFKWTERYRGETYARLAAPAKELKIDVMRRDTGGRSIEMMLIRGDSKTFVTGDWIRKAIRRPEGGILRSCWFDARTDSTGLTLEGRGWGHGIGMCQMGAIGRARRGQKYREILDAYYPGTEIKVLRGGAASYHN